VRSNKRLQVVRSLPCVRCGNPPPSEACHANWAEYGKSMGRKADDEYTVSLCRNCHYLLDTYQLGSREETKKLFEQWLVKAELMMRKDEDVF